MRVTPGSRLGPYEIIAPLGAGGMGEVWKARDTRLDRSVAIKILPAEFAANAQLKLRFEREAKTISQLSHPNICTLYDVGDGYLVMELLEGETLADKLAKGQLPVDLVLRYGIQIAEGLEKAHRHGVVHRDLKPGNIMITKSGAKLLDFGLAKAGVRAGEVAPSAADEVVGRTVQKPLTQEGTILGTFQYMAPEQLEGADADARTDIFALGAVLYEMATGKRAFDGKTRTSLIAAIVSSQPTPISQVQPLTPPALEHVVQRCLQKDPDDRWQTAHDVAAELRWISEVGSQAGVAARPARRRKHREWVAWTIAALGVMSAAILGGLLAKSKSVWPEAIEASILPPKGVQFDFGSGGPMEFSPDGRRLVFVGPSPTGENVLWIRSLSGGAAQPLAGTADASYPFWSPDSRFIGFFAGGKLKKIDANGGPPQMLCDAISPRGGTWSSNNIILFAIVRDVIYEVPSAGGVPKKVTTLDVSKGEADHRWPWFLPDGEHFLFLARAEEAEESSIWIGRRGSMERRRLTQASARPIFVNGYLLYSREKTLLAQKFDPARLTLIGDPAPLAEELQYISGTATGVFSASNTGMLAYAQGATKSQLAWYDRAGREIGRLGAPADYISVALSPDGRRIASSIVESTGRANVWIHETGHAAPARFTFQTYDQINPVWSPDGSQIAYSIRNAPPGLNIVLKNASGTTPEQPLWSSPDVQKLPLDWSRDGRYLLVLFHNPKQKVIYDLWLYSIADHKAVPLVQSRATEIQGTFSPDAKWFAYASNESGRYQIYAQPVGGGSKLQISSGGGSMPRWSRDGREIFYVTPTRKLMAVPVNESGTTLEVSDGQPLFDTHLPTAIADTTYAVTSDGQRFLMCATEDSATTPITLIANWKSLVEKR